MGYLCGRSIRRCQHHSHGLSDSRLRTQVLETYWCNYDASSGTYTNCCEDDMPTVSAMHTLFPRLLALPANLTTPAQRAAWSSFAAILPDLPLSADGSQYAAARVVSSGKHNNEGPELYLAHPHRVVTVGRAVTAGINLTIGAATLAAIPFYSSDDTWSYGACGGGLCVDVMPVGGVKTTPPPPSFTGLNDAVLLGQTNFAITQLLQKADAGPPAGYRFSGYAPSTGDSDPGDEYYVNMVRALQEMVLQSGDDGYENTTIVLFPSWPCSWDVSAKLWGPLNTTVEIEYAAGALLSLVVTPASRLEQVRWAACVNATS